MRQLILPTTVALALLAGCASGPQGTDLTAEGELMLTVVSAEEEELRPGFDDLSTDPLRTGEAVDQPTVMRECGAAATLERLTSHYDGDGDGALAAPEEGAVWEDRQGRSDQGWRRQARRWKLIRLIYDQDVSDTIEGEELAELVTDFDARCVARQAEVLAEFDVDGSGDLDETELAAVQDAIAERREERREERTEGCNRSEGDMERPEGDMGVRPPRGQDGESRLIEAWDADLDGTLGESELTVLRDTLQSRIRNGEPIRPMDAT